jgi:hypothetical protein
MDMTTKQNFMALWEKYFNKAELPITFYYTDEKKCASWTNAGSKFNCIIKLLLNVREGNTMCFSAESELCRGARRYLGFASEVMPDFEYFLSCGIEGKVRGERYKKSPEMVREVINLAPEYKAPGRFILFKRWDALEEDDIPQVVIFFAQPDVLSGLFTLANFDRIEPDGVIAPFGSGCSTIIQYPYIERDTGRSRGVLGMFDVSARPFVPENILTFAAPMNKFLTMINNMEESFLITPSWRKVQSRIN